MLSSVLLTAVRRSKSGFLQTLVPGFDTLQLRSAKLWVLLVALLVIFQLCGVLVWVAGKIAPLCCASGVALLGRVFEGL